MTLKSALPNPTQPAWDAPAFDVEIPNLAGGDYTPSGGLARGFIIATTTGTVKIDTPGGNSVTITSGLATGVIHWIAFTKMYQTGTTAAGIIALG